MNLEDLPELKNTKYLEISGGEVYMTFGKYKGELLEVVADENPHYLQWLMTLNMAEEVLEYFTVALGE